MNENTDRIRLQNIAREAMISRGLEPEYPDAEISELNKILVPAAYMPGLARDMRNLPWCSIDNTDSLDLDQLTYAESVEGNKVRILVAIADVDALACIASEIDKHASQNTSSVYTVARIFPMLPEKLSTNLTSLCLDSDRCAIVVDMILGEDGKVLQSDVYQAIVRNHAKLQYAKLAAWLDGNEPDYPEITRVKGLAENIRLQDRMAQKMKALRFEHGALEFETIEATPVFDGDTLKDMQVEQPNRAKDLIEDFMIAANGSTARYLTGKNFPSVRRVVRVPKQWDRIVELAFEHGFSLSAEADSRSLSDYLRFIKQNDPLNFVDMSISVLKLLGTGEYVVELPGTVPPGHFGLAVKDYTHSTAPNRRYPDLITQRLLKSAISGRPVPYIMEQLGLIATHCTKSRPMQYLCNPGLEKYLMRLSPVHRQKAPG
jgi:VacB/RNase II family 3'-5' exoribonuclease